MKHITKAIFLLALSMLVANPSAQAQFGFAGPTVEVESYTEFDGALPDSEMRLLFRFQMGKEWHVNSHTPLEDFLIPTALTLEPLDGVEVGSIVYPEHAMLQSEFNEEPLAVYGHDFSIGAKLLVSADIAPGDYTLSGQLRYQACNDTQCAPPKNIPLTLNFTVLEKGTAQNSQHAEFFSNLDWDKVTETTAGVAENTPDGADTSNPETVKNWRELAEQFDVVGREVYVDSAAFITFIENAEMGIASGDDFSQRSWLAIILVILLGGFALNLTPCVLPLIPINIAIIGAGAQAGSRSRGFAIGGAYGIGIALVYGALGLVVVLGISTAFGAINSSIWFNLGIAALFVVLALAMFDIIMIDFTKYQSKIGVRNNKGGSFLIAFFMGAISALLAGACVAPVLFSTLLYSQDLYTNGNTIGLLLPFLLGVGMALPWPFAGAGLSFLPKPGAWMTRVKQVFGVFILGFAAYYAYVAYGIYDSTRVDPDAVAESVAAAGGDGWETSLERGLQQALEEDKPVLIDFWATWCKNCLVMNKTVLKDPAVLDKLDTYIKIKYQAEDFSALPTAEIMEYYEVLGLPTYVILHPKK